jgi:hypothetical protein
MASAAAAAAATITTTTTATTTHTPAPAGGMIEFPRIQQALARISRGERVIESLHPASLLRFWLWGSDANEVCDRGKCDFHQMHLAGMVCTRVFAEAYHEPGDAVDSVPAILDLHDTQLVIDECGIFLPHFYETEPLCDKSPPPPTEGAPGAPRAPAATTAASTAASKTPPHKKTGPVAPVDCSQNIVVPLQVSLQQLRDIVYALQTQWPLMQAAMDRRDDSRGPGHQLLLMQSVDRLITQVFVWFGAYLFDSDIQPWQADDTEFIDNVPPTHGLALTDMGIKFYLNIFFVLFRLLFLQRHATVVPSGRNPETNCFPFTLEHFHTEAGVDDFHMLGMYFDIPAGCLLEYKHSYSGYYNNVSQCVYRHFPGYKRRLPVKLMDANTDNVSNLSLLPGLKQIYPEIEFAFEDHHFQREVSTVRVSSLLAHKKIPPTAAAAAAAASAAASAAAAGSAGGSARGSARAPRAPPHAHPNSSSSSSSKPKTSDSLQARIAACSTTQTNAPSAAAVEGAKNTTLPDWLWFAIGGDIHLVCALDGRSYKGHCRDLLAFYLSQPK